jgi:pimeloyl-ACP methyl ester carboxylesterase
LAAFELTERTSARTAHGVHRTQPWIAGGLHKHGGSWQIASPQWKFDDATFERSAKALDNPDHVAVVIHNYRWRMALAESDPRYVTLDAKISAAPTIAVPTITMEGDANGAAHPAPQSYASKFTGKYEHRDLKGGIGHNVPQEAPQAFAQAIFDVARWA